LRVPTASDSLPVPVISGTATCPVAQGMPLNWEGQWCRYVSRGSRPRSWCRRALASPRAVRSAARQGRDPVSLRVPRLQTYLPVQWSSGVTTCGRIHRPVEKGSGVITCPVAPDLPPSAGGLWRRHITHGSQPPRHTRAFLRHLTLGSSWPHQARGADNTLNAYEATHARRMTSIKCVQGIDTAGR
jgi:hypothetical protein